MATNVLSFTAAEIAAMSAFNADNMPANVRAELDNLNRITSVLTEAKNVQNNASSEKGNAWKGLLNVAFAIHEATADAPRIREIAFNSVLKQYVEADKDSAAASLRSYVSTARNVMLKMLGVTHTAEQIEGMSYKDVREALSPRADADLYGQMQKINENLRYVEKQIAKVKKAANAGEQMALIRNLVEGMRNESQELRDLFKSENDSNTVRANLARELADQRPGPQTVASDVDAHTRAA